MNFETQPNGVEAYRLGQFHGAVAGIIASAATYYLYKAYRPTNPFSKNTKNTDQES